MNDKIKDLLKSVTDKKPSDFMKAFDDIMKDKADDIIARKREEIVNNISGRE